MGALTMGLVMGGMGAASSLMGGLANSSQQRIQAKQYENQARAAEDKGRIDARNIDRQKHEISRQYRALQAQNNVSLGQGNVDASSGSAMQVAQGNAALFADDIGENAYNRALREWQTTEQVKQYEAQASSLKKTANNIGPTLLTSALSGVSGFMSGYSMAGGKFFSDSTDKLVNIMPENKYGIEGWIPEHFLKK